MIRTLFSGLFLACLVACSDGNNTFDPTGNNAGAAADNEPTLTRFSLTEPLAWAYQAKAFDAFPDARPRTIECDEGVGWLIEDGELEIRTDSCNYAALTQESLVNLPAGTILELAMSHGALTFSEDAQAHIALAIGGSVVFEEFIDIPSDSNVLRREIVLDFDVKQRLGGGGSRPLPGGSL